MKCQKFTLERKDDRKATNFCFLHGMKAKGTTFVDRIVLWFVELDIWSSLNYYLQ